MLTEPDARVTLQVCKVCGGEHGVDPQSHEENGKAQGRAWVQAGPLAAAQCSLVDLERPSPDQGRVGEQPKEAAVESASPNPSHLGQKQTKQS